MTLNLTNLEVISLAAEVAALANESQTEAVRQSLLERKARLMLEAPQTRSQRAASVLEEFRANLPEHVRGKRLTREEEDEILGYGPDGV
jgi:antitoxin VapB